MIGLHGSKAYMGVRGIAELFGLKIVQPSKEIENAFSGTAEGEGHDVLVDEGNCPFKRRHLIAWRG